MTSSSTPAPVHPKHIKRRSFIGGSDVRIIMGADEAALVRLWREKRGEMEPPDYSENLVVQLGVATETLNRRWYEKTTGQAVSDVQTWIHHPVIRWMAATLDGIVEGSGAVFEAKFCPGPSPKKRPPRSTWPRFSTTCGWPMPLAPCSPSSPGAANG